MMDTATPTPLARILMLAVQGYRRFISPLMGPHCRYTPTCSAYGLEALRTHGAVRGGWMTIKRIGRCHPFSRGGYDPVPPRGESSRHRLAERRMDAPSNKIVRN